MKANICFYCKKACGRCSWSRNFKPVPGWTAKPTTQRNGVTPVKTYKITACPEFEPDDDYVKKCKVCGAVLTIDSGRVSYCEKCAPKNERYSTVVNNFNRLLKKGDSSGTV